MCILLLTGSSLSAQKKSTQPQFVSGVYVVKLKPELSDFFVSESSASKVSAIHEMFTIEPAFANRPKNRGLNNPILKEVDLSLIYIVKSNLARTIREDLKALEDLNIFDYYEPKKISFISVVPNDPQIGQQNYLGQVDAYSGWDVTTGSTIVKVGIVDTGTDMDHPDLESELAINIDDPINGLDDDGDGFVDNYYGWDFVDNDHIAESDASAHGIHVSGIATAATNNGEGVASVGYATQYMPIRVANGSSVIYGYEGIVYAADMGCDIINCSWGGFGYSQFEEDIINYATYNKSALVVAAAGNSDENQSYYPAAYENCLAVSSVNGSDIKSSFTNYGYWVDIAAPGEGIYSTWKDDGYNSNTGTSMATPVVSGTAALVKAQFPQLSPLQIAERLKSTSVDINSINSPYENKIGTGRIDVGAAVSGDILDASVVFGNVKVSNGYDDVFKIGDSIFISGTFTNYLATSGNVTASIFSSSGNASVNHSSENLGVMSSSLQKDNYSTPFSFKILPSAELNQVIVFEVLVTDGVFSNTYFTEVIVNVDYLNISINNVSISIGSKGQIGYNGRDQNQGLGVAYKNEISQLYEAGLMIGTNSAGYSQVVDRIQNSPDSWDDDFSSIENIAQVNIEPKGDYFAQGVFNDANAFVDSIGLKISHSAYAFDSINHENYVVIEYLVKNTSGADITYLNVGIFADFDVANYDQNAAHTDWIRFMTYTQSTETGAPYFGIQLLTDAGFNSYCIDMVDGGNGGVDLSSNFTTGDKLQTLSSNRYHAGKALDQGNDVAQVTSSSGIDLLAGDSVLVAFAIHAADNLYALQKSADSAYYRYNGFLVNSVIEMDVFNADVLLYPNPAKGEVTIDVSKLNVQGIWSFKVYDATYRLSFESEVMVHYNQQMFDISDWATGVYFVEIQTSTGRVVTKLIKNP